jgi:hypothetical protein
LHKTSGSVHGTWFIGTALAERESAIWNMCWRS